MHVMRLVYKVKIIKVNICLYLHLYMYVWDQLAMYLTYIYFIIFNYNSFFILEVL